MSGFHANSRQYFIKSFLSSPGGFIVILGLLGLFTSCSSSYSWSYCYSIIILVFIIIQCITGILVVIFRSGLPGALVKS